MLSVYTTLQYSQQTPILQTKWLMTIETEDLALTVMQSRSHARIDTVSTINITAGSRSTQ